ncbi:MAG TPA: allantoinase AllB [Gammaproteobacteria bacterium]|nr:allantoinase AllB [Gammaproteobacteria bacterium]
MKASNTFALKSRRVIIGNTVRAAIVVVKNGEISELLDFSETPDTRIEVEDIGDKVLAPGLVDTHVHINEPGRTEWEGFNTATQSAAAGGITTVVDMPLNCTPVTTTAEALQQKLDSLQGKLWIDCGFWGGLVPDSIGHLEALIQAGVLGVKSFTIHSGIDDFPQVDEGHIRAAIPILAKYNVPYLIHAELDKEGKEPPDIGKCYQSFLRSRPRSWENDAVELIITLAREAKANGVDGKFHIVHLSSAEAIPAIRRAREQGILLTAESCPHYLTLFAEAIADGKTVFKCCPPIREDENRHALWQGLADGIVEFIVSDHSPCTPQLKHIASGDLEHAWGGISSLQFGLSIIWSEASQRGYSLPQIFDWMATRPAIFAGLGDYKGKIAPGYDADLLIFDDSAEYVIDAEMIKYRHKITPYEGRRVSGVVERTYVRGIPVYAEGMLLGTPVGHSLLAKNQIKSVA